MREPVAAVYHEMRSPVALIATLARAARLDCPDEGVAKRLLAIDEIAHRLLRTTEEVLRVARIAAAEPSPGMIRLGAVVEETVDGWRAGCAITLAISPGALASLVEADAAKVEALMGCILANAVQHGEPEEHVRVALAPTRRGRRLELTVENKVAEQRVSGLGIGSWLIAQLVSSLGWEYDAGERGERYEVRVRIPAARQPADG